MDRGAPVVLASGGSAIGKHCGFSLVSRPSPGCHRSVTAPEES